MNLVNPWQHLSAFQKLLWHLGEFSLSERQKGLQISEKSDKTPVTQIDLYLDRSIHEALRRLFPSVPIITEESYQGESVEEEIFFLIDPIDGTKAFISGSSEFTLNIGFIQKGQPIFGLIYAPALKQTYWGGVLDGSFCAFRQRFQEKPQAIETATPKESIKLISNTNGERLFSFHFEPPAKEHMKVASSLKFCRLAEGSADVYLNFGHTKSWDTASGAAILLGAKGYLHGLDKHSNLVAFDYKPPLFENTAFLATGIKNILMTPPTP